MTTADRAEGHSEGNSEGNSAPTLVIGEALVDIVRTLDGEQVEHVGGSPLNVAVGLSRLGHPSTLAAWVGQDARGAAIRAHLAADNVSLVSGSDGAERTATAIATLDPSGAATYEFDIDWSLPYALPDDAGHLHTGSIASVLHPGASAVRQACFEHRSRGTISFDPNCRPKLMGDPADVRADIEQLVGLSDVVKASDEDIRWLYGEDADVRDVARLWARLGPALVVVTQGPEGAIACVPSAAPNDQKSIAGQPVSVVDTVGAGDSFMAAVISGLLDAGLLGDLDARYRFQSAGWDLILPVLERAVVASAITVSRAGANPPSRAELDS